MNRMSLELSLRMQGGPFGQGLNPADVNAVRQSLVKKNASDPDFWSAVAPIELAIYEAMALGSIAAALDAILSEIVDVACKASSKLNWDSVTYQVRMTLEQYLETPRLTQAERDAVKKLQEALPGEEPKKEPKKQSQAPAKRKNAIGKGRRALSRSMRK
jgi:hypothetical protein